LNDNFFDTIRVDGLDQIGTFFDVIWPQLEEQQYLRHEKFDKFTVDDVKAIVKVDYVSKTKDDKIVITDWKTGADREEYESDLQIGAYVLWAIQQYNKRPEDIKSELVYLATGTIRPHEFSIEEIDKIKRKITLDYKEMNEKYEIDYFQADPKSYKCLSCQFASVCPDRIDSESTVECESKIDIHLSQKRIDFFY